MMQARVHRNSSGGTPARQRGGIRRVVRFAFSNHLVLLGFVLTLVMVLMAVTAPYLATHDPLRTNVRNRLAPPSAEHLMGTDELGRDVFSRVVHGSRVSMRVGFSVVLATTLFGTLFGLLAGYVRSLDGLIMRTMDGLMAFPGILLAIAILAALGQRESNVIIALSATYIPGMARVVRGSVLSLRELDFVTAARALGGSHPRIVLLHLLPNAVPPIIVNATFILALAILAEAGLSYIGVGTPPPTPSWGNILADGRGFMYHAYWMTVFPGLFIMIAVLGVNLLGDGLRDLIDPRMRGVN